jgi:hypothetical protein
MNNRASSAPITTARSHIEGSLVTTSLDRVLAACRRSQMTGMVRVEAAGKAGQVMLRAGSIARAEIGGWTGPGVLATLRNLRDGKFEIVQRLPDAVDDEGDPGDVPLAAVLRQCEERALTCSLVVTAGMDRARIEVKAGVIARVELNGFYLDDALAQVTRWPNARFHVIAARLDLESPPRDEATPLPPPPTPLPPPDDDLTPVRELRFETADTRRFERPPTRIATTGTRTAIYVLLAAIAGAIAAFAMFT